MKSTTLKSCEGADHLYRALTQRKRRGGKYSADQPRTGRIINPELAKVCLECAKSKSRCRGTVVCMQKEYKRKYGKDIEIYLPVDRRESDVPVHAGCGGDGGIPEPTEDRGPESYWG